MPIMPNTAVENIREVGFIVRDKRYAPADRIRGVTFPLPDPLPFLSSPAPVLIRYRKKYSIIINCKSHVIISGFAEIPIFIIAGREAHRAAARTLYSRPIKRRAIL